MCDVAQDSTILWTVDARMYQTSLLYIFILLRQYSQTSIYVLLIYVPFFKHITLYTHSNLIYVLHVLEFNICTIQSTYIKYWNTYIEVQSPYRVTWGL
jgi:hypothetical protein